jgi:methylglyoxal/glyoxal reductase
VQRGIVVFPKSARRERIFENADIFDFELSEEDCRRFEAMNTGAYTGNNPDDPSTYIYREID